MGSTNKYFGASSRFSSLIAGLNVPLFAGAANARLAYGRLRATALQAEWEDTLKRQQALAAELILRYRKNAATLAYYENTALNQAFILSSNATLQYESGATSFLEWTILMNQAIGLQAEYINALGEWNRTVSELNTYSPDF